MFLLVLAESIALDKKLFSTNIPYMENCISELCQWMTHNCVKLNQDKTELLMFHAVVISKNVTLTIIPY